MADNAIDVMHAFRVSGNIEQFTVDGVEQRQIVESDGTTVSQEVQVQKVGRRFIRGGSREKLFCGWNGWGPNDWGFLLNNARFKQGIFAESASVFWACRLVGSPGL